MSSQMSRIVDRLMGRSHRPAPISSRAKSSEQARARRLGAAWTAPEPTVADAGPPDENPLRRYFEANREGPGIWKWEHYFDIYHRHLARFVGTAAHVVEVGVYSGGSLGMWRDYFGPQCRISGVDIEEACRTYARDGIDIYIGDQADRQFWSRFREQAPPIDVVLDDGGHEPEQQMVTLEETLPFMRPGGVYLCEDIHGACNRFAHFAHALAGQLNACDWSRDSGTTACAATPFQATIHSVHCYPFVVAIETHAAPVRTLSAPKHGTQWQPFL